MKHQIEQLKELLQSQNMGDVLTLGCLDALNNESLTITSTAPVPLEEIRDIYTVRAKIDEKRGSRVIGYKELIPKLCSERSEAVTVHVIETSKQNYLVFTTPSMTRLIGILSSRIGACET